MDQDNAILLKEKFRYAVAGARCRTASFINPSMVELDRAEWMEGECPDARGWCVKIMKFFPGDQVDGGSIEQTYLSDYRSMSFGEMVLKLTEYEEAQNKLGFLIDPADRGQVAGAPLFRDLAEKQGMAFTLKGQPVAPIHGLITVPGRYPADAFKKVSQVSSAFALVRQDHGGENSFALTTPAQQLDLAEQLTVKKIAAFLNKITNALEENGTRYSLMNTGLSFSPKFNKFVRAFDEAFGKIADLRQSLRNTTSLETSEFISKDLELFHFQVFRLSTSWIIYQFANDADYADSKKAEKALQLSHRRCAAAWEVLHPDTDFDADKVFDFSKAAKNLHRNYPDPDTSELDRIVTELQTLCGEDAGPKRSRPSTHDYDY